MDASRRLRERDAAWSDIDGLRQALGLRVGEGLGLAEMTACVRAIRLTGDAVARAEELSARLLVLEHENETLRGSLQNAAEQIVAPEGDN